MRLQVYIKYPSQKILAINQIFGASKVDEGKIE